MFFEISAEESFCTFQTLKSHLAQNNYWIIIPMRYVFFFDFNLVCLSLNVLL